MSFDLDAIGCPGEDRWYDVAEETLLAYADATDDVPGGPVFAIVPVWETIAPASRSVASDEVRKQVVHYEQDMMLHRPIEAGMRLLSRATPVALLDRPNGTSLVIRTETRTEDGELANEQYVTEFFRGVAAKESRGERAPEHRFEPEGEPIAEVAYPVAEDQTNRYAAASGDDFAIHLDDEFARKVGLPGRIVHGFCTMAFAGRAVVEAAGTRTGGAQAPRRPLLRAALPRRDCDDSSVARGRRLRLRVRERRRQIGDQRRVGGAAVSIDLENVVAIDIHTHAEVGETGEDGLRPEWRDAAKKYFGEGGMPTAADVAAYYRERKMVAVVFTVDAETITGRPAVRNEEIAAAAAANPDVLIPFASIDPHKKDAVAEARRLIVDHGVRGFKFHPNIQAFFPNDREFYPLYEVIAEAGLPALFHTGHSGIGSGLPGGGGIRLKYSNPMFVDDVAVDFPTLKIVLAHPSFPWQDEAISVALHKEQVYIDLSGWSPKYFPPQLVRYANTQLRDRVLFGSDYPMITPDRWLEDFAQADFKDEVRPLILKDNAVGLLGLRSFDAG